MENRVEFADEVILNLKDYFKFEKEQGIPTDQEMVDDSIEMIEALDMSNDVEKRYIEMIWDTLGEHQDDEEYRYRISHG